MKRLLLVGFSQDVRLTGDGPKNYLVFETEDGKEQRVPVGEDSLRAVMELSYEDEKTVAPASRPAVDDDLNDETPEFGGDLSSPPDSQEDAPDVYQLAGDTNPPTLTRPKSESELPSV